MASTPIPDPSQPTGPDVIVEGAPPVLGTALGDEPSPLAGLPFAEPTVTEELQTLEQRLQAVHEMAQKLSGVKPGLEVLFVDPYPSRRDGRYTEHVAKVTRVVDPAGIVNLCVFVADPTDTADAVRAFLRAPYSEQGTPGSWHFQS